MAELPRALDLVRLLSLEALGQNRFRSPDNERNSNDRVYGGQLMGQVVAAAGATVPPERAPTALQMVFLAGARVEQPIDYAVTVLQEGKRFSSRHVRGAQDSLGVVDAHISFQIPIASPSHQHDAGAVPAPESLPSHTELPPALAASLERIGYAGMDAHPFVECRFVEPERELFPEQPGTVLRFWFRVGTRLPDAPRLHQAAFAYLTDWWLNYISIAPHAQAEAGSFYVASLNHSLWFHAPCRADEWLLCVVRSPWAGAGRGLSIGRIYRRDGVLAATAAQEALQVPVPP